MKRRLVRALLASAALVALASAATFVYLCWRINYTGAHDRAQSADAIVILGAHVKPDGQPGPDLTTRTLHGVRLFQHGLAPYVMCTGGYHNDRLSAAAVACGLAVSQGVPSDRAILADGSMTTREDAASARRLMEAHGMQSAILVSHPLHLERARILFEAEGITVFPSPTSTNLEYIPWRTRAWLSAREAMGIFAMALEEVGLPNAWIELLGAWVYGLPEMPASLAD